MLKKYEVGDYVRIISKNNKDNYFNYNGTINTICDNMEKYLGKSARIVYMLSDNGQYVLDIDGGEWLWTSEMFVDDEGWE